MLRFQRNFIKGKNLIGFWLVLVKQKVSKKKFQRKNVIVVWPDRVGALHGFHETLWLFLRLFPLTQLSKKIAIKSQCLICVNFGTCGIKDILSFLLSKGMASFYKLASGKLDSSSGCLHSLHKATLQYNADDKSDHRVTQARSTHC